MWIAVIGFTFEEFFIQVIQQVLIACNFGGFAESIPGYGKVPVTVIDFDRNPVVQFNLIAGALRPLAAHINMQAGAARADFRIGSYPIQNRLNLGLCDLAINQAVINVDTDDTVAIEHKSQPSFRMSRGESPGFFIRNPCGRIGHVSSNACMAINRNFGTMGDPTVEPGKISWQSR